MAVRSAALALTAVLLFGRPAAAQGTWEIVRDDVEHGFEDILHIWGAPLRLGSSDLPVLIAITEATLLTAVFDDEVQSWVQENPESLPVRALGPFRDSQPLSKLGYTRVLLPLSAALYLAGLVTGSGDLRDAGIGCATADVANTFARHLIGRLVGRLRPEYTDHPYDIEPFGWADWERRSFPGGHAANIMSCTAFWGNRFDLGIAEPMLYLLAGAIGVGRVPDGAHWLSDTVFGFTFGWAVGDEVADRFLAREAAAAPGSAARAGVTPQFYIGWRIPF